MKTCKDGEKYAEAFHQRVLVLVDHQFGAELEQIRCTHCKKVLRGFSS